MTTVERDRHTLEEIEMLRVACGTRPDVVVVYVFNDVDCLRPVAVRSLLSESPRSLLGRLHPARVLYRNSTLASSRMMLGSVPTAGPDRALPELPRDRQLANSLAVAAKIALHNAGAMGGTPGSPTPPGGASLGTMCTRVSRGFAPIANTR